MYDIIPVDAAYRVVSQPLTAAAGDAVSLLHAAALVHPQSEFDRQVIRSTKINDEIGRSLPPQPGRQL